MAKQLPATPSLEHLKKEAKHILQAYKQRNPSACQTLRHLDRYSGKTDEEILESKISLAEVQFALATEYGFKSWKALKKHVEAAAATEGEAGGGKGEHPRRAQAQQNASWQPLCEKQLEAELPIFTSSGWRDA